MRIKDAKPTRRGNFIHADNGHGRALCSSGWVLYEPGPRDMDKKLCDRCLTALYKRRI